MIEADKTDAEMVVWNNFTYRMWQDVWMTPNILTYYPRLYLWCHLVSSIT